VSTFLSNSQSEEGKKTNFIQFCKSDFNIIMAAPCCQSFQKWLSLMLYVSGIVLSSYAYYVEGSKSADENYVALCDINENVTAVPKSLILNMEKVCIDSEAIDYNYLI
jgi:hypothetical protein